MSDSSPLILFWHRRDLRLSDHRTLHAARQISPRIVGVFCFDPALLNNQEVAPARVAYLIGCLRELAAQYEAQGSSLRFLQGTPQTALVNLAQALNVDQVFWSEDVEPYAQERDRTVAAALEAEGITVQTRWDQLLCTPAQVQTQSGTPYTVFSPFWKNWRAQPKTEPYPPVADLQGLTAAEEEIATAQGTIPLPTAADLGFDWQNGFVLEPGETAATQRLAAFCDRALSQYAEDRNHPSRLGTSQLSPALKFGAIGIRTVWQAAALTAAEANSDEARQNIETWQQELAWREFYHHALYHFPALADGPYRPIFQDFPWENDPDLFAAWCEGRTGYPIIDAAMRELNQTGWMHNRCRMVVASFLTKDLLIDWRWGERYFMQKLVDGDLAANNGGWQWSASVGTDAKPMRIFNPSTQAVKFDPEGDYIRQYVPELGGADTPALLDVSDSKSGLRALRERRSCGYPAPIVNHKQQQNVFKQRYQACR